MLAGLECERTDQELAVVELNDPGLFIVSGKFGSIAFKADRSKLIERLIDDACVAPVLMKDGYALARSGTRKTYVGPVVARDSQVIEAERKVQPIFRRSD